MEKKFPSPQDRILAKSAEREHLLSIIAATEDTAATLYQAKLDVAALKNIFYDADALCSDLRALYRQEQQEFEDLRDSHMKKFFGGSKYQERLAKEEDDATRLLEWQAKADKTSKELKAKLDAMKEQRDKLEDVAAQRIQALNDLDDLYASVFDGPSPGNAEEDICEAQQTMAQQGPFSQAMSVVNYITLARMRVNAAAKSAARALDISETDMVNSILNTIGSLRNFDPNLDDRLEREELRWIRRYLVEASQFLALAHELDADVCGFVMPKVADGKSLAGRLDKFMNTPVTDYLFHLEIKDTAEGIATVWSIVNEELRLADEKKTKDCVLPHVSGYYGRKLRAALRLGTVSGFSFGLLAQGSKTKDTVSSVLATNPDLPPGEIVKRLYGHHEHGFKHDHGERQEAISNNDVLQTALQCGRWGPTTPSPLFLQAFADSLHCLDDNPMVGVVSPPLMGSYGTMPLTVIAPLADVMRHCSNLIARAEKEVFYITCSWSPSVAQALLKDALIELSKRAGRRRDRVVVKIMYDKPGPMNAITPHQSVKAKTYTSKSIGLPSPDEIPNIDLQVITLHRLFLGTLHAKFCLVDRKVAAVMSNNTEDNDNLEMMTHVEGPIVDSIYDTAIITWQNTLNPTLPTLDPSRTGSTSSSTTSGSDCAEEDRIPSEIPHIAAAYSGGGLPEHMPNSPHYDADMEGEIRRMQSGYSMKEGESRLQAANRQLNVAVPKAIKPSGPEIDKGEEMTPYIPTSVKEGPVPMALVSRPPYGPIDSKNVHVPQNEAWLSLMKNAKHDIFIQTPDLNAAPLLPAIINALKRGVEVTYYVCFGYNDPGEMIPGQGGTNDQIAQRLIASLPEDGPERKLLHIYNYVGKDQNHPIHHSSKARSCHIKLLIVDGSVGIQGSGNQDTQSWFHSQEINLMVDSAEICRKWREGIDRNQNTKKFGRVAADGIWRDAEGKPGKGYMGNPGTVMGLVKGVTGMVMKMKGAGGF
ncbi:hypothetical protein FGRMN_6119 [Fusarium graminum]|nr:hypothetical protein FGRMN_6119 [Fusarium graminum]